MRSCSAISTTRTAAWRSFKAEVRNYSLLGRAQHAAADDVPGGDPERESGAGRIAVADSLAPIEDPSAAVVGTGVPPVIAPGHTFGSVTDKISSIVLARKTPLGWWFGFLIAFCCHERAVRVDRLPVRERHRHLGREHPGRLGIRDRQLRLVDRHRPRRHADFRDSAASASKTWRTSINRFAEAMTLFAVACAGLFPLLHLGRPWLRVLAVPVSEHDGDLAAVPKPADVGRVRGLDVRDGVAALLVRRADPRPRDAARSLAVARRPRDLRHARDGLARLGAPLASLRDGLPAARGPRDAARRLGAHGRQLRLRDRDRARAGTRRSSRRTSSPARSTPASRWC